jgi:hypothetical protein
MVRRGACARRSRRLWDRLRSGWILTLLLGAGCSASGEERPVNTPPELLLAEFKAYCLDTQLKMDDVSAKAKAAGLDAISESSSDAPVQMRKTMWGHDMGDLRMVVSAGTLHTPKESDFPAFDSRQCMVMSFADYSEVLSAARAWVGIAPTTTTSHSSTFNYTIVDSKRIPLPNEDDPASLAALAEARLWSFIVEQDKDGHVQVSLTRFKQAQDAP